VPVGKPTKGSTQSDQSLAHALPDSSDQATHESLYHSNINLGMWEVLGSGRWQHSR
jgi:hypothetical protein